MQKVISTKNKKGEVLKKKLNVQNNDKPQSPYQI